MNRPFSSSIIAAVYTVLRTLRAITNRAVNKEPRWRHPRPDLTTGYKPKYYAHRRG
jgi:hydrogenase small subunit